jgi:hypothetical protein
MHALRIILLCLAFYNIISRPRIAYSSSGRMSELNGPTCGPLGPPTWWQVFLRPGLLRGLRPEVRSRQLRTHFVLTNLNGETPARGRSSRGCSARALSLAVGSKSLQACRCSAVSSSRLNARALRLNPTPATNGYSGGRRGTASRKPSCGPSPGTSMATNVNPTLRKRQHD